MNIKNWIILQFVFLLLVSCGQSEEITMEKSIKKEIKLEFNQSAVITEESVIFEINDNFDFGNLILLVNGKEITENTFTVVATEQVEKVSLEVKLKPEAPSGSYDFSVNAIDQSSSLDEAITFKGGEEGFQITSFEKPKSNSEILIFYVIVAAVILAIIGLIAFILKRDNMPFGKKTFQKGSLSFPNGESPSIRLEGQHRYQVDLSKILGFDSGMIIEPVDKYQNKKKKRFARFKNTTDTENILIYDGEEESIGGTEDLYHMDEVKIKTKDNRDILITYMNNKNVRHI